jgi:hypothetical protein
MNRLFTVLVLSIVIFAASSCRKNRLDPYIGGDGPSYYPLKIGNSWTYQVDSIKYNEKFGRENDTFTYQIKNVIESEFIDNEGKINHSFTRYVSHDTANWTVDGSFAIRMTALNVVKNYNNTKEIILKFPIQEFDFWDGNSLNNSPIREFEYESVHAVLSTSNAVYDSTCTVIHQNVENKVQSFHEKHSYASQIGPVASTITRIDEKDIDSGTPTNGYAVEYELIAFEIK